VSLDHLWAGWRGEYVVSGGAGGGPEEGQNGETGAKEAPVPAGQSGRRGGDDPAACVFCRIRGSGPPSPDNGVLWVGERTFAVLNAYPYASGHLMVLPTRHVGALDELTDDEAAELWSGVRMAVSALESAYAPEGINLGANLGQAAGAGIPRHLHMHAVPRWLGDTNFMTTVANARVLPEALDTTWRRLHQAWPTGGSPGTGGPGGD
jgi:ATP adenylyltransferase